MENTLYTLNILINRFEDLSKRYEALLQTYEDQCSVLSVQDMKLAQCQQRASLTHAHLAHAHKVLLTIGEKYLALKQKRHTLVRCVQLLVLTKALHLIRRLLRYPEASLTGEAPMCNHYYSAH